MRKIIALLAAAVLLSGAAQAQNRPQINNGDFETWTFDGVNLPNYFNSFQTADGTWSGTAYSSSNRQVQRSSDTRPGSTGSFSCSIWSRKVWGVNAQGNLTTGRVHAGGTSATSNKNYNYSDRDGSNTRNGFTNPCAMPFTGKPDSLVVWVKFVPNGTDSKHPYAKVTATIHDDFDYIDGYENTSPQSHVVATAINMTIARTNSWKRFSIPFRYTNNGAQPRYILLSAATNAYPGGGNENDYLYLDDITLVYNQSHTLGIPSQGWASLCLDFPAAVPADAKVYIVTGLVAGYAKLQEIPAGSVIPAHTGVIVRSDASSVRFDSSVMSPVDVSGNILEGSTSATSCQAGQFYVLSPASTKERAAFGCYQGTTLAPNKAYIRVR
ncbi:MAG: PCMD domain-containing protein [Bacteroidales bacterium]|nr:PCMD domain-containing protein [Bacteroidales bacterium]